MPWEEQWLKGRRGRGQKVGTKVGQGAGLMQVGTSGGRGGDEPHLPRGRIPLGSQSQQGQAWRRCQHGEKTGRGGWGPVGAGGGGVSRSPTAVSPGEGSDHGNIFCAVMRAFQRPSFWICLICCISESRHNLAEIKRLIAY